MQNVFNDFNHYIKDYFLESIYFILFIFLIIFLKKEICML